MIIGMTVRQLITYLGPYVLMGIIAILVIGLMVLVGLMLNDSAKEKKALLVAASGNQEDTLADEIRNQFKIEDDNKDRVIYTKSGVARTHMKQTRSAFAFKGDDAEQQITLESEFDNGLENTFENTDDKL